MHVGRPSIPSWARPGFAAVAIVLAACATARAADLASLRRHAEAREKLRAGDVAGAQAVQDAILEAAQSPVHAVVVASPCGRDVAAAIDARLDMAPLWVAGSPQGCALLLWGDFRSEAEARAAASRLPPGRADGAVRTVVLRPPLASYAEVPAPPDEPEPPVAAGAVPPPATGVPPPGRPRAGDAKPAAPPRDIALQTGTAAPVPDPAATPAPAPAPEGPPPSGTAAELFEQGNAAYTRGDFAGAVRAFEASLAKDPSNARTANNLGTAWVLAGDPVRAEAAFRKAIALDGGYARAWLNLGSALYAQDRAAEARMPIERSIELDPENVDARVSLAALLVEQRQLGEARRVIEDALRLAPADARLRRQLDQVTALLGVGGLGAPSAPAPEGPCAESVSRARRVRLAATLFEDGRSALARSDHAAAEAAFERALECDPTSGAILNHLGAARFAAGDAEGALAAWEHAVSVEPDRVEPQVNAALALRDLGRCEEAVARLRALDARPPPSGEAAFQLGRMLFLCGRTSEAATALERARTLSPSDDRPARLLDRLASGQLTAP